MGKKRKLIEIWSNSGSPTRQIRCPNCTLVQNENCLVCFGEIRRKIPSPLRHKRPAAGRSTPPQFKSKQIFSNISCYSSSSNINDFKKSQTSLIDFYENEKEEAVSEAIYTRLTEETIQLRPLFFEIPEEENVPLIGRGWLFKDLEIILALEHFHSSRGVLISGYSGTGKTKIILSLVEKSCFGRRMAIKAFDSYAIANKDASRDNFLARHVVAYHFCQIDNRFTCLVPQFVHSLSAQLCQAPMLSAYRDYLLRNPSCQALVSLEFCIINPSSALVNGILEPLNLLHKRNSLPEVDYALILIDAVCEAEYHRSDAGDTISSFLAKHILRFPNWIKLVMTVRRDYEEVASLFPFKKINLDNMEDDLIMSDLNSYIKYRKMSSSVIMKNVGEEEEAKLIGNCNGNFLFLKLTFNFIQSGALSIKSKVAPISTSQLFQILFNRRISANIRQFNKIEAILSTCLAALNPLDILEIYHSVNSLQAIGHLPWEDFLNTFKTLNGLLVERSDSTFMFFHSSFRDWLLRKEDFDGTKKVICDPRIGHAAISLRLARLEAPLDSTKTLEICHHILKAHIFKNSNFSLKGKIQPRDLQAFWVANSSPDLTSALASVSNIYYPNIKVSRLLLLAGASSNALTHLYRNSPILAVAAAEGILELVSLLIEFGADLDSVNEIGDGPLHLAAANNQIKSFQLLISNGATPFKLNERGECPLVKSALSGHLQIVSYIFSIANMDEEEEWRQQALIASSMNGHCHCVEFILSNGSINLESPDSLFGETPLTSAAGHGQNQVIELLLAHGANINCTNSGGSTAIHMAAKKGNWETIELLLANGADGNSRDAAKRTPLILAAREGHKKVMDILLSNTRGEMDIEELTSASDKDGLNSLCWASLKGQLEPVRLLLKCFSVDVNHRDASGRISLDLVTYSGNVMVAMLLLENGADLEHVDLEGLRPIDRAAGFGRKALVQLFLRKGAKLGPATWKMATGKSDIILILLKKLLEDGKNLSKKGQYRDAAYRFQYALRKIPLNEYESEIEPLFEELRASFIGQLVRIRRHVIGGPFD